MAIYTSLLNFEKSDLRKKLFLYFFTNPESRHYLREIAQLLEVDPTNLSRELKRLEGEGVFRSETSGHQKYFLLNKGFPLYAELNSAVDKTIGVPAALKSFFSGMAGIKRAFIYGSFAKGTEKAHSDIDVCLIVDKTKFKPDEVLGGISILERKIGREISYTYRTEQEWADRLKKKDSFVVGLEKGKKIPLIENEKN